MRRSQLYKACIVCMILATTAYAAIGAQEVAAGRGPRFLFTTSSRLAPVELKSAPVLRRLLAVQFVKVPLQEALAEISRQANVRFVYKAATVPTARLVSLHADDITLAAALTQVLLDTDLDVVFSPNGQAALVSRNKSDAMPAAGIVVGRVTDRGTNLPIATAQVSVAGKGFTRYTDDKGQYRIVGVPVGEHEVTVRRLGYTALSRKVKVADDETVTADFAMEHAPTTLTEVVTTATGERSRLEIGNAIGTIKADSVVATTLIRNMSDLLQARTPGVIVQNASGAVGTPSRIRIRGLSSISLNNDPIIILDGIRLNAASTVATSQTNVGSSDMLVPANQVGGKFSTSNYTTTFAPSRLDDIDPNTIESIDVLRGPSASSLYGTDAANGVIVIKTKRGRTGTWSKTLMANQGWSTVPGTFPDAWYGFAVSSTGTPSISCLLSASVGPTVYGTVAAGGCVQDSVRHYSFQNDPDMRTLATGTARSLSATASGGSDQLTQFFSLNLSDEVGVQQMSDAQQRVLGRLRTTALPSWLIRPNSQQNMSATSTSNVHPSAKTDVSITAQLVYRPVLNNGTGIGSSATDKPTGRYDTLRFISAEAQRSKVTAVGKHGILTSTLTYIPWTWLTMTGTLGGDYNLATQGSDARSSDCTTQLLASSGIAPDACPALHSTKRDETFVTTANMSMSAQYAPMSWLTTRTTVGEQYSRTNYYSMGASNNGTLAFGTDLLNPSPIVSSGQQLYNVTETRDESAEAGIYLETVIGIAGRFYNTFSIRQDAASAFGGQTNTVKAPLFPKLSTSWLVSDEKFFPKQSIMSSLRLRLAYGETGNQASQTGVRNNYQSSQYTLAGSTLSGMSVSRLGNPNLKPERGTEWEGGLDLSFLPTERVHLEWTMYRKFSRDAIVDILLPPSFGLNAPRSDNIGNVENRGMEVLLTANILDSRAASWSTTVNWSRNSNKLVHKSPYAQNYGDFFTNTVYAEGYPLNGYWGWPVKAYADRNGDGILSSDEVILGFPQYMGVSIPASETTIGNNFAFFSGALQVNTSFDLTQGLTNKKVAAQGGDYTRGAVDPTAPLWEQAAWIQAVYNLGYLSSSSTLRFQELSVIYNLRPVMARRLLRTRSASIGLVGRNLALWSNYIGKDPNVNSPKNYPFLRQEFNDVLNDNGNGIPQPRNVTFRLNLGF